MAAINLDSLSTFWQSVKSYFAGRLSFLSNETVLYEDTTNVGVTSLVCSRAITNYSRLRITFKTNDNCGYTQTIFYERSMTTLFLYAFFNNPGSTARSYYKVNRFSIGSDYKTISAVLGAQVNINSSGVTTSGNSGGNLKIVKVVEIQ